MYRDWVDIYLQEKLTMNYLTKVLFTTLTFLTLAVPAFATQPENPVCNPRNCDTVAQVSEIPDPECIGQACEISTSKADLKPLCRYPNCRPNGN